MLFQESAEKHIFPKTSRSTFSVPWINPELKRKSHRRSMAHAMVKQTGNKKLRSKFESLRRKIKACVEE